MKDSTATACFVMAVAVVTWWRYPSGWGLLITLSCGIVAYVLTQTWCPTHKHISGETYCNICYYDIFAEPRNAWQCANCYDVVYCGACFTDWVFSKQRDNDEALMVKCRGCDETVPWHVVKALLDPKHFARFDQWLLRKALMQASAEMIWCPGVDCPNAWFRDGCSRKWQFCEQCRITFCVHCLTIGRTTKHDCARVQDKTARRKAQLAATLTNASYKCTMCDTLIEKNGGCPNMRCTHCGTAFDVNDTNKL